MRHIAQRKLHEQGQVHAPNDRKEFVHEELPEGIEA